MNNFCLYQQQETIKKQNQGLMNEQMYNEFYAEIDRMRPMFEYLLANKKNKPVSGMASLRSGNAGAAGTTLARDEVTLRKYSEEVYAWLDKSKMSRIRMFIKWQSAGGLSFGAQTYHRIQQCWIYHGNEGIADKGAVVCKEEFAEAIIHRHRHSGEEGMEPAGHDADWQS